MITQSFLYNAIFFTYALVLTKFYHVTNNAVPLYGLAFAVATSPARCCSATCSTPWAAGR